MHITWRNPYVILLICDYNFLRNVTPVPQRDICLLRDTEWRESQEPGTVLLSLTLLALPLLWPHTPAPLPDAVLGPVTTHSLLLCLRIGNCIIPLDWALLLHPHEIFLFFLRSDGLCWIQLSLVCGEQRNVSLWNVNMPGISGNLRTLLILHIRQWKVEATQSLD